MMPESLGRDGHHFGIVALIDYQYSNFRCKTGIWGYLFNNQGLNTATATIYSGFGTDGSCWLRQ